MFLNEVSDGTSKTLQGVILKRVHPGSIIITDCFASYEQMSDIYSYLTVNHSIEVVESQTGSSTNTIEGTLNGIKTKIAPRNRTSAFDEHGNRRGDGIDEHLAEFRWRRKNKSDLWVDLLTR